MSRIQSFRETQPRYALLRFVGTLSIYLGGFLLGLGCLLVPLSVLALTSNSFGLAHGLGLGVAFIWSIGLFISGLQMVAFGSFCRLAIHLEENTRATAQALDRLRSSLEPKAEVDPRSIFLS